VIPGLLVIGLAAAGGPGSGRRVLDARSSDVPNSLTEGVK